MNKYAETRKTLDGYYICTHCEKRIPGPFKRRLGAAIQLLMKCPHCHIPLIWPLSLEEMEEL